MYPHAPFGVLEYYNDRSYYQLVDGCVGLALSVSKRDLFQYPTLAVGFFSFLQAAAEAAPVTLVALEPRRFVVMIELLQEAIEGFSLSTTTEMSGIGDDAALALCDLLRYRMQLVRQAGPQLRDLVLGDRAKVLSVSRAKVSRALEDVDSQLQPCEGMLSRLLHRLVTMYVHETVVELESVAQLIMLLIRILSSAWDQYRRMLIENISPTVLNTGVEDQEQEEELDAFGRSRAQAFADEITEECNYLESIALSDARSGAGGGLGGATYALGEFRSAIASLTTAPPGV